MARRPHRLARRPADHAHRPRRHLPDTYADTYQEPAVTSLRTDITAGDSGAIADINTAWGAVNALTRDTGDIVYSSGNMLNGWAGYVAPSFSLALRRIGSTVTLAATSTARRPPTST